MRSEHSSDVLASGFQLHRLRNDYAEVSVIPEKGADIYSFVDPRTGIDVLFKTPWGARAPGHWQHPSNSLEHWVEAYSGGWQVLLPNGGDECVENGTTWGYHGEASLIPWSVVDRTATSLTLETMLFSVPLRIRREIVLAGPVLRLHEVVTNESPEEIEFMWSHHPAFGAPFIEGDCVLSTGFRTLLADELDPGTLLEKGSKHVWPTATTISGIRLDLSRIPGSDERRSVLAYLIDMEEPFFAITNPRLRLGVGLHWSRDVFETAWLWQEVHSAKGWPWFQRGYAIAVEPASTIPGHGMSYARARGYRGVRLDAFATKEVVIEAVLFEGSGPIEGIKEGGIVVPS